MPIRCSQCQTDNRDGARFCDNCGAKLAPVEVPVPPPVAAPEPVSEAERRQLTVMFVDLVGFTEITERLDPEDLADLVRVYQRTVVGVIKDYDGFVARYFGDGVLAYFCYPRAHEDDAERAVRAGLEMVRKLATVDGDLHVRVGIATGKVVVGEVIGEGASQEATVMGVTPNLAARLQGLAEPDQVVISPRTYKLVREAVEAADMGTHRVKGIREPVRAWQVVGVRDAVEPREGERPRALVGRGSELRALRTGWQTAAAGERALYVLVAPAGVGKSAMVGDFRGSLDEPHAELWLACSPYHRNSAFHPVLATLQRVLGIDDLFERPDQARQALADGVPGADVRLLAGLLGLDPGPDWPPMADSNEGLRDRQVGAAVRLLQSSSRSVPLLVVVEDAHWIDPSSLELLDRLVATSAALPMMVLVTYRPSFRHEWPVEPVAVALDHLGPAESEALVRACMAEAALPQETVRAIVRKTDGIPLYIEEVTRMMVERGGADLRIPDTLQDSLMARLDRLPKSKRVAQLASMIGREFTTSLLTDVSDDPAGVGPALTELAEAGLIHAHGDAGGQSWQFRHALIADAAYQSLLRSTRQTLHRRIAETLIRRFEAAGHSEPEQVAQHFAAASDFEQALAHFREAATRAIDSSANEEAVAHLRAAMDCLDHVDDAAARLEVWIALAGRYRILERADEALAVLEQAAALAERVEQPVALAEIYYLIGGVNFNAGKVEACLAAHERARSYAAAAGSLRHEVRALSGIADAAYLQGRMRSCVDYTNQALGICEGHPELDDLVAGQQILRGVSQTYMTRFGEAHADCLAGLALAHKHGDLRSEMVARIAPTNAAYELGRYEEAIDLVSRGGELAQKMGATSWALFSQAFVAQSGWELGRPDAVEHARRAVADPSVGFGRSWCLGILALVTDDTGERVAALDEGDERLARPAVSHDALWFRRHGIDACLLAGDRDRAARYVDELEAFTASEPLPWATLRIRMARLCLARDSDGARALRAEFEACGWVTAQRQLDRLLAASS